MTPSDHIKQARRNFKFLESINSNTDDCIDWQVTACFYTALHLINAHLAGFGMKYFTHHDVNEAINPENSLSLTKVTEDAYTAYKALSNLSRRSRYLVAIKGDKIDPSVETPAMTNDKHQAKAFRHLNEVISYYSTRYNEDLGSIIVKCQELKQSENLKCFKLAK